MKNTQSLKSLFSLSAVGVFTLIGVLPFNVVTGHTEGNTSVQINADGSKVIHDADGSTIQVQPDGSKVIHKPDGTSIQIQSDGTKIIRKPDGTQVEVKPGA
jgi:hypothetical protein